MLPDLLQALILISIIAFFIFEYFEKKRVKDEREEFIRLKTFEFVQKLTLSVVTVLAFVYLFYPSMPAAAPILVFVLASMYGEIFGKFYYRRQF